ncbi:MAG TPA: DUF1761 domain-containing protein [Acidimicrobiia bacterium]|nr:DUF1761 domain-containing protein [Acidimicrobiia bacterium]
MIFSYFSQLNWLAIVVATFAWFAFSAVWYSVPPLSKAWQDAAKVTPGEGPPLAAILVPTAIGYFVTTVVIALLAKGLGASTVSDGLGLGVALGIGFGLVSALIVQLYEQKGGAYWLINGINSIIALSIVGVILAVWD